MSRTRAQVLSERAIVLSVALEKLARELDGGPAPDREAAIARQLDLVWGAFYGWSVDRMKRMLVVEAIAHAAEERAGAEELRERIPHGRGMEADTDWIVRTAIADVVDSAPSNVAVEGAVAAWLRGGKPRTSAKEPLVWDAMADLIESAGLGRVTSGTLKTEWSAWQKVRG